MILGGLVYMIILNSEHQFAELMSTWLQRSSSIKSTLIRLTFGVWAFCCMKCCMECLPTRLQIWRKFRVKFWENRWRWGRVFLRRLRVCWGGCWGGIRIRGWLLGRLWGIRRWWGRGNLLIKLLINKIFQYSSEIIYWILKATKISRHLK